MDETGPSILFSILGFFTPTVLFVLLNLVIATIALTSRTVLRHHNQEHADDHPDRPGPTGLDRIRSIGLFRFGSRDLPQPEPDHHPQQTHYHHHQDTPPSVLERVRSGLFGLGGFRYTPQPEPEPDHYTQQTIYHHHQDTPPSVLERVRSGLFGLGESRDTPQPEPDRHTQQTHYHQHTPQSALERVRSGLSQIGSRDIPQPETHHIRTEIADPDPEPEHYDMDHHFRRIQSESALPKPVMAEERGTLRKLASALSRRSPDPVVLRRRPVAGREEALPSAEEEEEEEGEVDARADDFISRFKQQLKLQRLDSILRYKEMLTRGSSGS